jgi:hypothetical protein
VEVAADALADALTRSDYDRIRALLTRSGWVAGFFQSEVLPTQNRSQVIDALRKVWDDGRLRIVVQPRPLLESTRSLPGDRYVRSTWAENGGQPQQQVYLVLRNEGGEWYWSGALFGVPSPEPTPQADEPSSCDPLGEFDASSIVTTPPDTLTKRQLDANAGVALQNLAPRSVALGLVEQLGQMEGLRGDHLEWSEPSSARVTFCYDGGKKLRVHLHRPFPNEEEPIWAVREYQRSR